MRVLIATKNAGKAREFHNMLALKGFEVQTLLDYPDAPDVEETGQTFEENAIIKAEAISKKYGIPVIADDSGLEIDALSGRPGVFSARYAGKEKDDQKNMKKVLQELTDVPAGERNARFICSLAVAWPGEETFVITGDCEGQIALRPIGENGFGYDPIFYLPKFQKTMAQLTKEEKNQISHRADALRKLEQKIRLDEIR